MDVSLTSNTEMPEVSVCSLLFVQYGASKRHHSDETFRHEAGWSTGSIEKLRFMVLGGDDALMDEACGTILRKRENGNAFQFGELKPSEAHVRGRQVSVLKTPFRWLEHLKSYYIFSNGVKSLKYDLQFFESLLFPGPHAFLLVHRDVKNSGRENYLLQALADVFGEKVLDYCMLLFMDRARHNHPKKNYCLKMCGGRYHILQNTDESVHKLFKKTEAMAQWKNSSFFTNHLECFRKAEIYFKAEYAKKTTADNSPPASGSQKPVRRNSKKSNMSQDCDKDQTFVTTFNKL